MKKILLSLVTALLLSASCNHGKPELEDMPGYAELAGYNGGIVASKMTRIVNKSKEYSLGIRMPGVSVPQNVIVDKSLFDMFDMSDTIRIESYYEDNTTVTQSNPTEATDAALLEIQALQQERKQITSTDRDYATEKPVSRQGDGLTSNAVILIEGKPYIITVKEIK